MVLSLVSSVRHQYLDTIRSVQPPARWKIVVVDQWTRELINSVLKMYDILEENVQQVDHIESPRQAQPRLEAVYILVPTSQNVDRVLQDFNPPQQAPPPPSSFRKGQPPPPPQQREPNKYAAAHLFFIDAIPDRLVDRLKERMPRGALQSLKEIYVNFWALESKVFSLKLPNVFHNMYAPPERTPKEAVQKWEQDIGFMSRALVNVLATLGEFPLIRYFEPPSSPAYPPLGAAEAVGEGVSKRLAFRIQKEMEEYQRNNPEFPPKADPPRPQAVLFVTERAMDLFAPFLHEFTYQAMANDLLEIEDGTKYKYSFRNQSGDNEDKEAILTDEDRVWTEIRHWHMKDVLDKLIGDFKTYATEAGESYGNNKASLNDIKDMLASLPQMKEAKDKLSLHLTMSERVMAIFEKKKLPLIGHVEQCCATGLTPEGGTPKTLVEDMVPLLDDRDVSLLDKLRIIACYIMYKDGVPEEDKKRLFQHARLGLPEIDAINNLYYLGINISKDTKRKRKPLFKQNPDKDAYDISRYQPAVRIMLDEHFTNKLDQSLFPYVKNAPVSVGGSKSSAAPAQPQGPQSLRSSRRPKWLDAGSAKRDEARQRAIVFMAGGMTHSEMRAVYLAGESHKVDAVIGSTHIWTPESWAKELGNLEKAGSANLGHQAKEVGFQPSASKPTAPPPVDFDSRYRSNGSSAQNFSVPFSSSTPRPLATSSPSSSKPSKQFDTQLSRQPPPSTNPNQTRQVESAINNNRYAAPDAYGQGGYSSSRPYYDQQDSYNSGKSDKDKKKKGLFRF